MHGYTNCYVYFLANLSTASPTSPTQPPFISPKQQHEGARGPAQLVVMKGKESEEKCEEQQPVEATDGGTSGKIYVQNIYTVCKEFLKVINFYGC